MEYIGEHSLPGTLGNLLVALSLAASLVATIAYFISTRSTDTSSWIKLARKSYYVSVFTAFSFIAIMFYLLVNQYYEYTYVWEHNNSTMSFRYILVCFWGGQEGSFMLWIFWHAVLALVVLRKAGEWEPYVMTIFALVQSFLVSMLLGIYIGEHRLGANPFGLQRETTESFGTLWSLIPNYLQVDPRFADGRGLNPLLQNYWMVIHPPTLFLGFALTVIPFAYAIAGLWRKTYTEWLKPALPWTFAGILVLGTGILMGGAWAYESLSFGGFWAWDPVENASFVPWLTLVGAGHLILLNKNQPKSVYSAFFFTLISFILILYSTFLTRSGILGETSVHSFTGEGMLGQLLAYLLFFVWLSFVLLMVNKKMQIRYTVFSIALVITGYLVDLDYLLINSGSAVLSIRAILVLLAITISLVFLINSYLLYFPRDKKEENLWSREFWMFIAALVLLLSALQIIYNTSLPVINLVFDTKMHLLETEVRNEFYNSIQTGFAIIVAIIMASTQFLKYKDTSFSEFGKKILISVITAFLLTFIISYFIPMTESKYHILLFCSLYAIVANLNYWFKILKGKIKNAGSSIAHVGFGMILLGSLISQNRQEIISETIDGDNLRMLGEKISNRTDAQLFRGDTILMKDYFISYQYRYQDQHFLKFRIDYFETTPKIFKEGELIVYEGNVYRALAKHQAGTSFRSDLKNWELIGNAGTKEYFAAKTWLNVEAGKKIFDLEPFIQLNDMSNVAEPGTKHFLSHDIFTHLVYADPTLRGDNDTLMKPFVMTGKIGDTLLTPGFLVILNHIESIPDSSYSNYQLQEGDIAARLNLTLYDIWDVFYKFGLKEELIFAIRENEFITQENNIEELKTRLRINKVVPKKAEHDHASHAGKPHVEEVLPDSLNQAPVFTPGRTEILIDVITPEFIVMRAIRFPWINILWLGSLIMFIGTAMAVWRRVRKN